MPVYKLGPSQSGGFRILLPPDPKPRSNAGKVLAYVLTFGLGLLGGVGLCAVVDNRAFKLQPDKDSVVLP